MALQKPKVFFVNTVMKVVLLIPLLFLLTYYFGIQGVIVSLYVISCWQVILLIFIIVKYELVEKSLIMREIIVPLLILCVLGIIEYFSYHNFIIKSGISCVKYIIIVLNIIITIYLFNKLNKKPQLI